MGRRKRGYTTRATLPEPFAKEEHLTPDPKPGAFAIYAERPQKAGASRGEVIVLRRI